MKIKIRNPLAMDKLASECIAMRARRVRKKPSPALVYDGCDGLDAFLLALNDARREAILAFHNTYRPLIYAAKGSAANHQSWPGGYADHLMEICSISLCLYKSLGAMRRLSFRLESALIVAYFHDIEKIWKYTTGAMIAKEVWFEHKLPALGICFSPEETNALNYVHGELADYSSGERRMGKLAAFCHAADCLSARLWFDQGRGGALQRRD